MLTAKMDLLMKRLDDYTKEKSAISNTVQAMDSHMKCEVCGNTGHSGNNCLKAQEDVLYMNGNNNGYHLPGNDVVHAVVVSAAAHLIFLVMAVLALCITVESRSTVVTIVLGVVPELDLFPLLMTVVEVGAEVTAVTKITQFFTEVTLLTLSGTVLSITSPTAVSVVIVGVVVGGWVGVLLYLFFMDWLQPTSCVVASAVVRSAVPGLAPRVPGSYGPRVCGPAVGLLLDLSVGDEDTLPDPLHLL